MISWMKYFHVSLQTAQNNEPYVTLLQANAPQKPLAIPTINVAIVLAYIPMGFFPHSLGRLLKLMITLNVPDTARNDLIFNDNCGMKGWFYSRNIE